MTDSRSSEKVEFKGLRRASFARALHVPAIGRRKHVEIVENANRSASPSGKKVEKEPQRPPSPNPVTVSIATRGPEPNEGDEGADIPDIPLRRAHVKRVSADYSGSSLSTLERMLTTAEMSNGHHFGPINPNAIMPGSEKSLPDVPEVSSASTMRPEADSYLESVRETHSAPESTIGSAMSPPSLYPRSAYDRSTIEPSITSVSLHTDFTSPLPALQTRGADEACDALEPLAEEDVEPGSFDLVIPATNLTVYNLERRSELLFSVDHLRIIFGDPVFLQRFLNFVSIYRPQSVPLLRYYLEALKAIRALEWINSMIAGTLRLDGHDFTSKLEPTANKSLLQKAEEACERLARDELPAYITHVWTEFVEKSMRRRITGTLPAHLHDMSDGLAEVFCITDPSRPDNPIVFTSEEFHRMTQYGLDYVIGRNCRFLQGPKTNPFAVKRIRDKVDQGKQHYETFLNYRRDGSPFMNLLMCAPLMDSTGIVRYYLGAQVDVSGLAKDCSGLESLRRLVDEDEEGNLGSGTRDYDGDAASRVDSGTDVDAAVPLGNPLPGDAELGEKEHFRLLCEILNRQELETVRRFGGRMHRSQQEQIQHESSSNWAKGRVILHDNESSPPGTSRGRNNSEVHDFTGNITISPRATSPPLTAAPIAPIPAVPTTLHGPRVPTIYEHFLVVRPYPSLKILFASPSLRVPGILQSHLMGRIGGSKRIHEELEQAFALGQGVTAKVRWLSGGVRSDSSSGSSSFENGGGGGGGKEGRPRWIHCTPLIGSNGSVGVWMVVVVDEDNADGSGGAGGGRMRRDAPAVSGPRSRGGTGGDRRKNHDSLLALDTMSLNDFAAMNSLPQDEDLRQHVRQMYEETRRRERAAAAAADSWDRKWSDSRDGERETIRVKEPSNSGSWRGRVEELRKVAYSRSRSSSPFTLKVDD